MSKNLGWRPSRLIVQVAREGMLKWGRRSLGGMIGYRILPPCATCHHNVGFHARGNALPARCIRPIHVRPMTTPEHDRNLETATAKLVSGLRDLGSEVVAPRTPFDVTELSQRIEKCVDELADLLSERSLPNPRTELPSLLDPALSSHVTSAEASLTSMAPWGPDLNELVEYGEGASPLLRSDWITLLRGTLEQLSRWRQSVEEEYELFLLGGDPTYSPAAPFRTFLDRALAFQARLERQGALRGDVSTCMTTLVALAEELKADVESWETSLQDRARTFVDRVHDIARASLEDVSWEDALHAGEDMRGDHADLHEFLMLWEPEERVHLVRQLVERGFSLPSFYLYSRGSDVVTEPLVALSPACAHSSRDLSPPVAMTDRELANTVVDLIPQTPGAVTDFLSDAFSLGDLATWAHRAYDARGDGDPFYHRLLEGASALPDELLASAPDRLPVYLAQLLHLHRAARGEGMKDHPPSARRGALYMVQKAAEPISSEHIIGGLAHMEERLSRGVHPVSPVLSRHSGDAADDLSRDLLSTDPRHGEPRGEGLFSHSAGRDPDVRTMALRFQLAWIRTLATSHPGALVRSSPHDLKDNMELVSNALDASPDLSLSSEVVAPLLAPESRHPELWSFAWETLLPRVEDAALSPARRPFAPGDPGAPAPRRDSRP